MDREDRDDNVQTAEAIRRIREKAIAAMSAHSDIPGKTNKCVSQRKSVTGKMEVQNNISGTWHGGGPGSL